MSDKTNIKFELPGGVVVRTNDSGGFYFNTLYDSIYISDVDLEVFLDKIISLEWDKLDDDT